jgi:hypothetical protein
MEMHLCARWLTFAADKDKQPPLVSRWKPCPDATIDQEELARTWGLLEGLNQPPPNPFASLSFAIR